MSSVGELDVANRFDSREVTERDHFQCSKDRVGGLALGVETSAVEHVGVITLRFDGDDFDLIRESRAFEEDLIGLTIFSRVTGLYQLEKQIIEDQ